MIGNIVNASTRTVEEAVRPMPDLRGALYGWFRPLGLSRVTKQVKDFQTVEVLTELKGDGLWQPFGTRDLVILPEGQRAWRWYLIQTTDDVILKTDDIILRAGVKYRVMADADFRDNGFVEYRVVNAYDNPLR